MGPRILVQVVCGPHAPCSTQGLAYSWCSVKVRTSRMGPRILVQVVCGPHAPCPGIQLVLSKDKVSGNECVSHSVVSNSL